MRCGMKRRFKKRVVRIAAGSFLISNVMAVNVNAKTLTLGQYYKKAYDASIRVKDTAEKNGVKAFFTAGKVSGTKEVVKAVQAGLQKDIENARIAQLELLNNYPSYLNAVETFSSLVDNYQHPIYERIVSEIEYMEIKDYKQGDINNVKQLIEVVPKEFKTNFSSALDEYQQYYINKVLESVDKAEKSKNKLDVEIASKQIDDLDTVILNQGVSEYVKLLKVRTGVMKISIKEVVVIDSKTIEIKGEGLNNLSTLGVNLEGNEIDTIEPQASGVSAKVKFKNNFVPNETKNLYIYRNGGQDSFQIKYVYTLKSVLVNNVKYKSYQSGQAISIRVDGSKEDADLSYLKQAGYTIKFSAIDKDKTPANIFKGGYATSNDGILDDEIYEGSFEITVDITKAGDKTYSAKQTVVVEKGTDDGSNVQDVIVASAVINKESFNYRRAGQKITFRINNNGNNCDAAYLTTKGYIVKFTAVNDKNEAADIFIDGATSYTGALKEQLSMGAYTVQMQIYRNGSTTISSKQTIEVADGINSISSIGTVTLRNVLLLDKVLLNSTNLVLGEQAIISEIQGTAKGQNGNLIIPNKCVDITTSNKDIIEVNKNENNITLKAVGTGNATITLKSGNIQKNIYMKVVSDPRRVSKVVPMESDIKLVLGKEKKFNVLFLDQYGDPIMATMDQTFGVDLNKQVKVEVGQSSGNDVASITSPTTVTANDNGVYVGFAVTGSNKGSGSLTFKDCDNKILCQGSVTVSDKNDYKGIKVEPFYDSKITKTTFEVGQEAVYQVANINSESIYNGLRELSSIDKEGSLTVEAASKGIVEVSVEKNIFRVKGVKEGVVEVLIKDKTQIVEKVRVTIVPSTIKNIAILKVNFIANPVIDYANKLINIKDVLDIREDSGKDYLVGGIEHNKTTMFPVRINVNGEIYIDEYNDGTRTVDDTLLGKVTLKKGSDNLNVITGIATNKGDSYTLNFKILVDNNKNGIYEDGESIATSSISVNVKK